MQVTLTRHAEHLLRTALDRQPGQSPEAIIKQALAQRFVASQLRRKRIRFGYASRTSPDCVYPIIGRRNSLSLIPLTAEGESVPEQSIQRTPVNVFYLDASAWVKRYVQEPGSSWIHALFDARSRLATATLGYVETLAALCRRLSREAVKTESRLAADWQNMLSMELSFDVMEQAADLTRQYRLQGADAVHLAVALHLRSLLGGVEEKVIFVASDRELLQAAENAGLAVEDPVAASLQ